MGVEEIIAVIERESAEEAVKIVEEAERQASQIVASAEAEVRDQVGVAIERLGPEIRAASQRRINTVRLHILEGRARDDAARLTAVFDAAEEQVRAIAAGDDPPRWSSALSALSLEAVHSVGEGASVRVRARDVPAVSSLADAGAADVVPITDGGEPGLVVTSRDGRIEVDARLSVRLERARSLLAEAVAQVLRFEPVDREPESAA